MTLRTPTRGANFCISIVWTLHFLASDPDLQHLAQACLSLINRVNMATALITATG